GEARLRAPPRTRTGGPTMADRWYYAAGGDRQGPFTPRELRDLVDAGRIQPMDTIWKEGHDQGVPAHQVKNLFPPEDDSGPEGDPAEGEAEAAEETVEPPPPPKPKPPPPKKGRAVALKGAVITSQDGEIVFYSRKCVKCGFQETGRSRMPIRPGV